MARYSASVRKQGPAKKEHCSADPEKLKTIGRARGHQVRIERNASEFALYTVGDVRQESPDRILRVGDAGLLRLGTNAGFTGTVNSQAPHPTKSEEAARLDGDFIERDGDDGTNTPGLIAIAPHGGMIEEYTDGQAKQVASRLAGRGASWWACMGWRPDGGAHARWHITSTDIHQASFPRLKKVISRGFTYAVAFHGFDDPDLEDILIGGRAPIELKREIEGAIKAVVGPAFTVRVFEQSDPLGGSSERNIVNRLTANKANGIQIEQKMGPREDYDLAIADAIADVYGQKLG